MTFKPVLATIAALVFAFGGFDAAGASARTTDAPSGCALLPISLLEQTFGEKFQDPPLETSAPPAYDGPAGANCQFFSKPPFAHGHQIRVDFMVYQESSAQVARTTFEKVAVYVTDKSRGTPAVGDAAYWAVKRGEESWLHVLKGNTHFSLGMEPNNDTQLLGLATTLAKQF